MAPTIVEVGVEGRVEGDGLVEGQGGGLGAEEGQGRVAERDMLVQRRYMQSLNSAFRKPQGPGGYSRRWQRPRRLGPGPAWAGRRRPRPAPCAGTSRGQSHPGVRQIRHAQGTWAVRKGRESRVQVQGQECFLEVAGTAGARV